MLPDLLQVLQALLLALHDRAHPEIVRSGVTEWLFVTHPGCVCQIHPFKSTLTQHYTPLFVFIVRDRLRERESIAICNKSMVCV